MLDVREDKVCTNAIFNLDQSFDFQPSCEVLLSCLNDAFMLRRLLEKVKVQSSIVLKP